MREKGKEYASFDFERERERQSVRGSERGLREKWRKKGRVERERLKGGEREKWRKREGGKQRGPTEERSILKIVC
jgi:hypothetical protein